MNWAQHHISKGELVEIFHKENNIYLSFSDFRTFLLLPPIGYPIHCKFQLQETIELSVFSYLCGKKLKHHFLPDPSLASPTPTYTHSSQLWY